MKTTVIRTEGKGRGIGSDSLGPPKLTIEDVLEALAKGQELYFARLKYISIDHGLDQGAQNEVTHMTQDKAETNYYYYYYYYYYYHAKPGSINANATLNAMVGS
ncbi:hypothetical protein F4604DRAFT_1694959 [Suillus subluteus]|nr:hypothetical protein F4604DRAFT_1694959 [Suillus subluteus]